MCGRWRASFAAFLEDMGEAPAGTFLERRDNAGSYSPENCYWATRQAQMNNKRTNHRLTINGKTQTIAEWSRQYNLSWDIVWDRITIHGWDAERALTTPVRKQKRLTAIEREGMRAVYAQGGIQQKELAKRYGVSTATVCAVVNRKWRKS